MRAKQTEYVRVGLAFAVLLAAAAGTVYGQNRVQNPGFETAGATSTGAENWDLVQASGGPVYGVRTNNNPNSGGFHFEARLASTGGGPIVRIDQSNIPVTGGETYQVSFYANRLAGSAGDVNQYNILWSGPGFFGQTGFITYTPGANVYERIVIEDLVAPVEADTATVVLFFAGAASPSASATVLIDDVAFSGNDIGVSTNFVPSAISRSRSISWFASNGIPYQVQWASELSPSMWNDLGSGMIGDGSSNTVVDSSGEPDHNLLRVIAITEE